MGGLAGAGAAEREGGPGGGTRGNFRREFCFIITWIHIDIDINVYICFDM